MMRFVRYDIDEKVITAVYGAEFWVMLARQLREAADEAQHETFDAVEQFGKKLEDLTREFYQMIRDVQALGGEIYPSGRWVEFTKLPASFLIEYNPDNFHAIKNLISSQTFPYKTATSYDDIPEGLRSKPADS